MTDRSHEQVEVRLKSEPGRRVANPRKKRVRAMRRAGMGMPPRFTDGAGLPHDQHDNDNDNDNRSTPTPDRGTSDHDTRTAS